MLLDAIVEVLPGLGTKAVAVDDADAVLQRNGGVVDGDRAALDAVVFLGAVRVADGKSDVSARFADDEIAVRLRRSAAGTQLMPSAAMM